jgi:hypothetical protein
MKTTNLGIASVIGLAAVIAGIAITNFPISMQPEYDLPENDSLCLTHILVQTTQKITDREIFTKIILGEIEKLDSRFDVPDRYILVTNMQDNKIRISLDGLWSEENSGKRLIEALERSEFIESVLDQGGLRLAIECQ